MSFNSGWAQQTKDIIESGFAQFCFPEADLIHGLRKNLLALARQRTESSIEKLEDIHLFVRKEEMNDFRLAAISIINQDIKLRKNIENQMMPFLTQFLGEDLAVQRNMNLVLLAPRDLTSQLPLHADTWTGHSPFEIALLIPLTEVVPDQKMFILPKQKLKDFKMLDSQKMTLQEMTFKLKDSFQYLNLQPGDGLLFWHHIPHGNSENISSLTHWSLNLRFKNIFTPYGQKKLGDYFIPLKNSVFTEMVFEEASWNP